MTFERGVQMLAVIALVVLIANHSLDLWTRYRLWRYAPKSERLDS